MDGSMDGWMDVHTKSNGLEHPTHSQQAEHKEVAEKDLKTIKIREPERDTEKTCSKLPTPPIPPKQRSSPETREAVTISRSVGIVRITA